jgi:hypothetical protein
VTEFWIGGKKMAVFTEGRIVMIDLNQNRFIFANRKDKTYVETILPLDLAKILPAQLVTRLAMFRTQGEVKETSETKKSGKWDTRCYEINTWIIYEGARLNQRDTKAWYTTNLPFDLNVYMEILPVFLTLSNFDEALINEMKKIKAVRVSSETTRYIDGKSVNSKREIVEMSEKKAPAGIYSIPKAFKKKDQLTIQDLRTQ